MLLYIYPLIRTLCDMKHLLPICLLLTLISTTAVAQVAITVSPETFVHTGNIGETDISYHVEVTNISAFEIGLHWSREVTNAPAGWLTWICDKNLCYLPTANNSAPNKPNMLAPGEKMDFQIHYNPVQTEGCLDFAITFTELEDPGVVIGEITSELCASTSTSVANPASGSGLKIYPNPTTDFFQVSDTPGLRYVEVFNIVGNKIRAFDAAPQRQYAVGDLNEGIYLVRLVSNTGKVLKTIRLSKR